MKAGDKVYILMDWPTRQVEATILERVSLPTLGRTRQVGYRVRVNAVTISLTFGLNGHHYSKPMRVIRKSRFPGVPIANK